MVMKRKKKIDMYSWLVEKCRDALKKLARIKVIKPESGLSRIVGLEDA